MGGGHDPSGGVEASERRPQPVGGCGIDQVELVENDDVGELDLVDEQIADSALVLLVLVEPALDESVSARQLGQEVRRVHNRDHGVQAGDVPEGGAVVAGEGEGGGHGHRLRDAGRLDQEVVEAALAGQPVDLLQEVVAQGAADAPVGHLDQPLLGMRQGCLAAAYEGGVDVDLAHVIDDHRDTQAVAVAEDVVEQRGLARPQKSGEDRDGQTVVRVVRHP